MLKHLILLVSALCISQAVVAQTITESYVIAVTQNGKSMGTIEFKLLPEIAPKHAAFMVARIAEQYYNGSAFHRVIPGFMIQGGDPNSKDKARNTWGTGGYPVKVPAEFNSRPHLRGIMSAARTSDPNSFGGQFFICVAAAPWLDGQYTVFGEVIAGMSTVDLIVNAKRDAADNPIDKISMTITQKVTSVSEGDEIESVLVYPTPTHDEMTISLAAPSLVTLANVSGVTVKQMQLDAGTTTVSVSDLPCGAYVLMTESAQGVTARPILITAP
jgi:peptidyl-prolyl cis-trans isomerase B (cyclophilin B)